MSGATWEIREGDCLDRMRELADGSVDAVCTDPPYGLEFMGKDWDRLTGVGSWASGATQMGHRDGSFEKPMPVYSSSRNPMCRICRKHQRGTKRCECAQPDFDERPADSNRLMQEWHERWAREALRVLKPGGFLLAFGGTRTFHRLACAVEDAGFEIRDCLMWLYGAGFPKSLNVGRAMDDGRGHRGDFRLREARAWEGHGTTLKPGWEPIIVARKPLSGTVAATVLEHGTGGLNIDGCRIGTDVIEQHGRGDSDNRSMSSRNYAEPSGRSWSGRWPANVVLSHSEDCVLVGERQVKASAAASGPTLTGESTSTSRGRFNGVEATPSYADENGLETVERWACVPGCPVRMLDDQAGELDRPGATTSRGRSGIYGPDGNGHPVMLYGDRGGPSRFFYCAKTSRAERNAGLDGFDEASAGVGDQRHSGDMNERLHRGEREHVLRANTHPTVKPINLMRWLVRLVTPPGGTVLDPFLGSGTTGIAAVLEGFEFVGIEREAEYVQIAEARIRFWAEHPEGLPVDLALQAETRRQRLRETGQMALEVAPTLPGTHPDAVQEVA